MRDMPPTVAEVAGAMRAAPSDILVQARGCERLQVVSQDRSQEPPGPFGGRYIPSRLLGEGYGEVAAEGLLSIVASNASEASVFEAARACFFCLAGATVQNHREKGLLLFRTAPRIWEAAVGYFRRFRGRPEVLGTITFFAGMFGSFDGLDPVQSGLDQAGGFEYILEVLDQNYTDPAIFQAALAALSDNVQSSQAGADIVAKHGGVQHLLRAARRARGPRHYHEGNGFGLRYEVLEDVVGLLKHDHNRQYANEFIEGGLMEDVIALMQEEPDDLFFQDHCCQTFNWLTNGNEAMLRKLAESQAAIRLIRNTTHCFPNCRYPPAVVDRTWHGMPPPSCFFTSGRLATIAWDDALFHP